MDLWPPFWVSWCLTLFPLGPGHYGPYYHESVCCYPMVGGRFPKIHDFVPFAICQDLEKLLLTFFTKKFEKLAIKNFQGSSSIRWKMKKIKKEFFEMKLKIWNPHGLRITHTKFESNQRQFFFRFKGGTLWCFSNFQSLNVKTLIDDYGHKGRHRLPWMLK